MRRLLLLLPLTLSLILLHPTARAEARASGLSKPGFPPDDAGRRCVNRMTWQDWGACIAHVPPDIIARFAQIRASSPLPEMVVEPMHAPEDGVAPHIYAQVVRDNAFVYSHPAEAVYGLPPARWLGRGFIWASIEGKTAFEGRDYYQINSGEYVPADALRIYTPSRFQGVSLGTQPERPFAWILRAVQPRLAPGGEVNADAAVYHRYQLVQIFSIDHLGDQVWYLIGPDQWINQVYVGKVTLSAVPAGVGPGAAWIDINLFEQTLAAYVGDRMVYATLVSSGLPGWNTPPGLYQVWHRAEEGKMSGAENRADYYFLEDVPWSLYFFQAYALHGAYWHDGFGYQHSHGCVNLSLPDAKWLFEWAPETVWVRVQSGD